MRAKAAKTKVTKSARVTKPARVAKPARATKPGESRATKPGESRAAKPKKAKPRKNPLKVKAGKARAEQRRLMKEHGLVAPSNIKLDSPAFAKLQSKWYKELADSGFDDLEWIDSATGKGQNSNFLKRPAPATTADKAAAAELYYSLFRNFVTHAAPRDPVDRTIVVLYSDGFSLRDILAELKTRHKVKYSLTVLYQRMHELKERVMNWNRTSANGLFVTRAENAQIMDKFFEDRFAGVGESVDFDPDNFEQEPAIFED